MQSAVINRGSVDPSNPGAALAALLKQVAVGAGEWRQRAVARGEEVFPSQSDRVPVCVLTAGLVKLYYSVSEGEEWTKSYVADCGVFGPTSPGQRVAQFGARALEECSVGAIDLGWFAQQLDENEALQTAFANFQSWLFERKRQREEDLLCLTAEKRYLAFTRRNPNLAARLEQQEIAAYLRITPVALSRIKRRLRW